MQADTGIMKANMGDVHADMGRQTRTIRVSVPTMPSYILILHLLVHLSTPFNIHNVSSYICEGRRYAVLTLPQEVSQATTRVSGTRQSQ